ncbi:PH domain-containing protein [Streptomyces sp. NPDC002018]|uniref:PH domain-containing protein n=1 Tax=Streptomyces sp. NPDC002018 TaxID=3364629 RepID=UPI00368E601C
MSESPGEGEARALGEGVREARAPGEAAEEVWRRLDRRTLLVTAVVMAGVVVGTGVPVGVGLAGRLPLGETLAWVLTGAVLLIVCGTGGDYVRWRRTRYRTGPERAELHTGLFLVKRRSLARERIRTVDLTANLLLRLLGLVKVRIGTGEQTGGESTLELDPVTRAEGERLRTELLGRVPRTSEDTGDGVLAAFDPGWIRYAPLSFLSLALAGAGVGGLFQLSEWFGVQDRVIDWVGGHLRGISPVWGIVLLAGFLVLAGIAGVVGALALWIEMWWNYRLEREPGGTLRVRRGLFTSRSVSIEERRLRGVELVEPLGVRLAGAARLDAVATGLAHDEEEQQAEQKSLLPPAPRAVADEVAARILREPVSPTRTVRLVPHPRAARARRLRWALSAALLPPALLAVLGLLLTEVLLTVAAAVAVVLVPVAVLLALDAYRNLGHGLGGAYLVTRSGTLRRTTVALQRAGVTGWTIRQSSFQRRAGLLTVTATTAAGDGAYHVYDTAEGEGLAFAAEAVPGLLEPFLTRVESGGAVEERPGPRP